MDYDHKMIIEGVGTRMTVAGSLEKDSLVTYQLCLKIERMPAPTVAGIYFFLVGGCALHGFWDLKFSD